jgi:hypothetical protein
MNDRDIFAVVVTNIICRPLLQPDDTNGRWRSYAWWHIPDHYLASIKDPPTYCVPPKSYKYFRRKRAILIDMVGWEDIHE